MLSWGWEGVKVWSILSSLGVVTMLRAVFKDTVGGWAWYDQLLLFGGLFLLMLGILAFINQRRIKQGKIKSDNKSDVLLSPEEIALKNTSDWLLEVLAFNKQHVYKAVQGSILRWNFSGLEVSEGPFFEIHLKFINTSIFTLDFSAVDGEIKVGGVSCFTKPKANVPQRAIIQGQDFYVIVTQGVLPEMAKKILLAGNNKEKLNFDLSGLTLNIETVTKGYEGLKPNIKFDSCLTPDIATWLELQDSHKIGYWT